MDWSSGGSREGAQGEGGGRDPPFSRPSWKKKILETVPPFSKGLDDRLPPPPKSPQYLSQGLDPALWSYYITTLQNIQTYFTFLVMLLSL